MTDRPPEIEQHYQWFEDNFPEAAKHVTIVTLDQSETPETAAKAEHERDMRRAYGTIGAAFRTNPNEDVYLSRLTHIFQEGSKHPQLFGNITTTDNQTKIMTLGIATDATLDNITRFYPPSFTEAFNLQDPETRRLFMTYFNDQEKIHLADGWLNEGKYERLPNGNRTPLAQLKFEAVGDAYSTLSLLQRQQRGEFGTAVEPFLDTMRQTQRKNLLTSTDASHALVDEASLAAETWAKKHHEDLKSMSPRDMLDLSHKIADDLPYPSADDVAAFNQRHDKLVTKEGATAWEHSQWEQAEGKNISIPFSSGEMTNKGKTHTAPKPPAP